MNHKISQLAFELCAIPSISGQEREVLEFLTLWLNTHGFIVEKIAVDEKRFNLFTYFEKRSQYSTIFCTHLDTVAPFIAPRFCEDNLWGRGAVDAKGIAATMIYAVMEQKAQGFCDAALLFTVGEEEASDGARVANRMLSHRAKFVVVGEPTEGRAAFGQKGSMVFDLVVKGKAAHSATPHLGVSATHQLVSDLKLLLDIPWPRNEIFHETFLNIGVIDGGSMRNVIADHARASCIMRTACKSEEIVSLLKKSLSSSIVLDVKSFSDPFLYFMPQGFKSFLAGFGSDAPYLRDVGQTLLIGPGSLSYAHTVDERISFLELEQGFFTYLQLASQLRDVHD